MSAVGKCATEKHNPPGMKAPLLFSTTQSLAFSCAVLFASQPAPAQLVSDGATSTLSNVTNSITGNVTVGTNGSFTLLVLSDNCLLTNSGFSTIGQNASAKSNEVRLVSPTARWLMGASSGNFLFIGSNGAANRLVVSNGATASVQANAYLGYISESASNNQVWVTGSNSVWSSAASIEVGFLGSGNQVVVSNGGTVLATNAILGDATIASNNLALVTGAGSLWSSANVFYIGDDGSGNRLVVSEGGAVRSSFSRIGGALLSGSGNNLALITGSGSVWSNATDLEIGRSSGINNQLVVSNGASVFVGGNALLGLGSGANANSVLVTDPGTRWLVGNNLYVGSNGALSRLVVSNGATVAAGNLFVGLNASSTNNRVVVDGGTLRVTNAAGTSVFDVRRGTNVLTAGLVEVDQLLSTNTAGAFELNGGTLSARNMTINNGQFFRVGNGVSAATLKLAGNGLHAYANGLIVSTNGLLTGNGTIDGAGFATVSGGGMLSPGNPIGKIAFVLNTSSLLQGEVMMEISKNGSVLTNDQIQVSGTLNYGGALAVTKLGPTSLATGNRFPLFSATAYAGSFSALTLPPLLAGLYWTNKLSVDGSIEVAGAVFLTLETLPPNWVNPTTATLNGVANPSGNATTVWFEFGFTTNYGSVTPAQPVGNGSSDTNFSQTLTGLVAGATYHFRAVASNNVGILFGEDRSFPSFVQQAYLKASNTGASDASGVAVAIAGDTVVVGARFEDSNATGVNGNQTNNSATDSGAAYVFVRDGNSWTQQAYLKASNSRPIDQFGFSVAISGDTIAVGAPTKSTGSVLFNGVVFVFVRSGTNWTQQASLQASNLGDADSFGASVAVTADTLVVGAPFESSNATGVNGDGSNNSAFSAGAAYVFVRSGTNWTQQAYLKASNTESNDNFGTSVAVAGDTVVVGAPLEDSHATGVNGDDTDNTALNAGAAYVFVRNGITWTQHAYLKASNTGQFANFGSSVAASAESLVVGAKNESGTVSFSGAAYVFVRNGANWTQQAYLKASVPGVLDHFGAAVSISDGIAVIGAPDEDSNATGINGDGNNDLYSSSGAAYVFVRDGTNWKFQDYCKASNTESNDLFGVSVAVSGNLVIVGATGEDSSATGIDGDQSDNTASASGAAYVFGPPFPAKPVLVIALINSNQVTLSWTPPTPGFSLQETLTLSPVSWSNSPSGETNPITLPVTSQTRFFRLFKP